MTKAPIQPALAGAESEAGDDPLPVRRRLAFVLLLQVLVGLLVGVVSFDIVLAGYDSKRDLREDGLAIRDELLSWTVRPGYEDEVSKISSLGLRSPEIPADAPRDEVRILGVGASQVFGAGEQAPHMDHTWSAYLEEYLNENAEGHWRVLNGGVPGYSIVQSTRRALQLIEAVDPDLIIVFALPSYQSWFDTSSTRRWIRVGERFIAADVGDGWPDSLLPAVALADDWLSNSALYTRYRTQRSKSTGLPDDLPVIVSRQPLGPEATALFEQTTDAMAAFEQAATAAGVATRGIALPARQTLTPKIWARYLRGHQGEGAPPVGTPVDEPVEVLVEAFEGAGIRAWSMATEGTIIREKDFMCDRSHWDAKGHRVMAGGIMMRLQMDGLLDELRARRAANPR